MNRQEMTVYQRNRRRAAVKSGNCGICVSRPAQEGTKRCERCAEYRSRVEKESRQRYYQYVASAHCPAGHAVLCPICDSPYKRRHKVTQ